MRGASASPLLGAEVANAPIRVGWRAGLCTLALASVFVALAIANRLMGRIMLVPTAHCTLALSLATAVMYVLVYGFILLARLGQGLVTVEMLRFPLRRPLVFAGMGFLEGVYLAMRLSSGSRLPGVLVAVLNQAILPGSVFFSFLILGKRYNVLQLTGVMVVVVGVLETTAPSLESAGTSLQSLLSDSMECASSYLILALSWVLKELALTSFAAEHGEKERPALDIFVVSTAAGIGQMLSLLCFWVVFTSCLAAPGYLALVWDTLWERRLAVECVVLYWVMNITWNISAVALMQRSSAVVMVMTTMFALPASALLFCTQLPLLEPNPFDWRLVAGLLLVLVGNLLYNYEALAK